MDKEFKSLENFIYNLIHEFNLQDFSPPIKTDVLQNKIKSSFSKETPFWKPSNISGKGTWESWCFLDIKTFKPWEPVSIGITCKERRITLVIFDEMFDNRLEGEHAKVEVDLTEAWRNHKILYANVLNVLSNSISYSNRGDKDEQFHMKSL